VFEQHIKMASPKIRGSIKNGGGDYYSFGLTMAGISSNVNGELSVLVGEIINK
jgi:hypothetical protein